MREREGNRIASGTSGPKPLGAARPPPAHLQEVPRPLTPNISLIKKSNAHPALNYGCSCMGALKCDSDEVYCNGQVPFIWTNTLPSDDFTPAHRGNKPRSSYNNQALGNHIDRDLRVSKFYVCTPSPVCIQS